MVGDRRILHLGVVLGSDGYGFHWMGDHHHKIPQLGIVVIEDDVEIGANTCIDRATLGETRIGRGSKFDNLVHIAHNNQISQHVLTGQVAVAGSSRLGNGVVAGGQAGIADRRDRRRRADRRAQSGVIGATWRPGEGLGHAGATDGAGDARTGGTGQSPGAAKGGSPPGERTAGIARSHRLFEGSRQMSRRIPLSKQSPEPRMIEDKHVQQKARRPRWWLPPLILL